MNVTKLSLPETLSFAGLFAFVLLLPFGRLSELGVLLCLLASAIVVIKQPKALWANLKLGFAVPAFACVLLAALISCVGAIDAKESLGGSLALLRFFGLIIAATLISSTQRARLGRWIAYVLVFWMIDALVQSITGYGLRGAGAFDRATGLFGQDNPKLGLVLAAMSPLALYYAPSKRLAVLVIWPLLALVILLAGARAGWMMFALASLAWIFQLANYQYAKALRWCGVGLLFVTMSAAGLYALNTKFASRIERTAQAFQEKGLDFAMAGRLPIWQTAVEMSKANPINGVGVRNFRYAYPGFASANDPWVQQTPKGAQGATHPHQLLLEILSETGVLGLLCWLAATIIAWRAYARANSSAWPWACALCILLFPINTHTAMYSSFWAGVLWFLVAMTSSAWSLGKVAAHDHTPADSKSIGGESASA
jgi:O-antigen ligase